MSKGTDRVLRALRYSSAVAVAVAIAAVVPPAGAAEQCISKKAKDNLAHCPAGKFQAQVTKRPQVSFSSAPESIDLKKREDMKKPKNPTDIAKTARRDERRKRLKPRLRKLLITEIANVERLYKDTPRNSKDRPVLMRRLAEGYVELESASFRDKVEAEVKAQKYRRKSKKKYKAWRAEAKKAKEILKVARRSAIKYYKRLKKQYPKWCQFPNQKPGEQGCTDEVLYYLAYEYEQAGNLEKARKAYLELTENWPKSKYVPNAYLAFGELFFQEAQGDPSKWPVAGNFYREVIKYKPPGNKLYGYARYKLAYVYWNQEKFEKAINEFKLVIDFGTNFPQLPGAKGLANSARRDIIPVYAIQGDPAGAYTFFKPISGDPPNGTKRTYKMMEDLGQTLLDTGHYKESIILYKDLIKRNKGDNWCFYQANISKATLALKSGQKQPIVKVLKDQLGTYNRFKNEKRSGSKKLKCANDTAGLMTETAMAWHLEAVGSGGVRGTGDKRTMSAADELYKSVVDNFTSAQFKKFKFPRIVKEDWPTIPKIRYHMADLLFFQKKWAKCGPAFDAVVAENPNGPDAAEAAYASMVCYQNIYNEKYKKKERKSGGYTPTAAKGKKSKKDAAKQLEPKKFSTEEKGMLTAFNRYLCYIKPPKNNKDAQEQYVEVKYARARTYFNSQHWEEAAEGFRDVAINHPDHDAAIFAAHLYLESINVLGSKISKTRPTCYDNMEGDVPTFIKTFCTGKNLEENEDHCSVFFRIQRDVERIQAQETIADADKTGGPEAIKKYQKGAGLYWTIWKKYGEEACSAEKKPKPECEKMEEVLYNTARAYQAARLIKKAIDVRMILINPKYRLNRTEPARKAVYEIGGNWQAIAVYDLAAHWYERFAKENPRMEKAPTALSDAVVLRLGLGQEKKANEDAGLFRRQFGMSPKHAAQAAQIGFAIGAYYVDRENWRKAEQNLSGQMRRIDTKANFDVQIQAHGLLGRVYDRMGRMTQADAQYRKVLDYYKDPAAANKKLDALGGSKSAQDRRVGKVLTAVGEALYHFADKERVKAAKHKFPEYKGSGERKDVLKFINDKVTKWVEKKEPAIKSAEKAYLKVIKLKPPPPKWVIKAGAAVGNMWGSYIAQFRAAPYPKEWDKDGVCVRGDIMKGIPDTRCHELRSTYLYRLDKASERQKKMAKRAYVTCLDYSVRYQYFDEDSRSCEEWLSKKYPKEFHLIDEFKGSATRVNSGLDERPLPLDMKGLPVVEDTREAEAAKEAKEKATKKDDKKK